MGGIHGHSERGVVNAVFEAISGHPNAKELMEDLLGRIVLWENRHGVCRRSLTRSNYRLVDFEVHIEPSLSDFGDPDVLILADYQATDGGDHMKETFFIEAKIEPFLTSSPLTKQEVEDNRQGQDPGSLNAWDPPDSVLLAATITGCDLSKWNANRIDLWRALSGHTPPDTEFFQTNKSTILHELFLKYRFYERHLRQDANFISPPHNEALPAYGGENPADKKRSVGSNPLVLRLVRRLMENGSAVRFVSLTTDRSPDSKDERSWPMGMAVAHRFVKMWEWNHLTGNPLGAWYEISDLLSWFDIWDWTHEHNLQRLQDSLIDNEDAFTFWPSCPVDDLKDLMAFLNRDGVDNWTARERSYPWRFLIDYKGDPCLTAQKEEGFTRAFSISVRTGEGKTPRIVTEALQSKGLSPTFAIRRDNQGNLTGDMDGCLDCILETLAKP